MSESAVSLIREALERDCWRMKGGKRDFSIRDDALIALAGLEEQLSGAEKEIATERDRADELEEQLEAARQSGGWAAAARAARAADELSEAMEVIAERRVPTTFGGGHRAAVNFARAALVKVSSPASEPEEDV